MFIDALPVSCGCIYSKYLCRQVLGEHKSPKAIMLVVAHLLASIGACRRAAGPAGAGAAAARGAAGRRRRARQALGRALRGGRGRAAFPGAPELDLHVSRAHTSRAGAGRACVSL